MAREVCKVRAVALSARYGEMKDVRAMVQESEKRRATYWPDKDSASAVFIGSTK